MAHPLLGTWLIGCVEIVTWVPGGSAKQILGGVDALMLRCCVTLFMHAAPGEPVFRQVLGMYFGGAPGSATE